MSFVSCRRAYGFPNKHQRLSVTQRPYNNIACEGNSVTEQAVEYINKKCRPKWWRWNYMMINFTVCTLELLLFVWIQELIYPPFFTLLRLASQGVFTEVLRRSIRRNCLRNEKIQNEELQYTSLTEEGPAADATNATQPWGLLCNPVMKINWNMHSLFIFPSNGAPVEWNWQDRNRSVRGKPVPVPLFPPQIPHWLTRDRTAVSAVEAGDCSVHLLLKGCLEFLSGYAILKQWHRW
jgi:hypothetical protein